MISLPKQSWIVAAGMVGCVACGGGGSGGADGGDVVRLVGGRRTPDGRATETQSVLLRNVDGQWQPVGDGVLHGAIGGIVFASADDAWAWGPFAAFRSRDGGRTWEDALATLPPEFRDGTCGLQSFVFANAMVGYVAGFTFSSRPGADDGQGPFVWRTADGGETWDPVTSLAPGPEGLFSVLGQREEVGEILRRTAIPAAMVVQRFERALSDTQIVSDAPVFPDDLTSVGQRGWVALTEFPSQSGDARPVILRSEQPGAPWIAQTLPDVPSHNLELDFCDRNVGLAGAGLATDETPIAFWTDDGGEEWQVTILEQLAGSLIADVACVSSREMWLVANSERAHLVRSTNGGRSFEPVAVPVDGRHELLALASNAALR